MAETLFNEVEIDGYFLEYDTDRAGGFEPLRFFPKGKKQLVLGLVTSKSGTLEKKDEIKRRIEEATQYVALDQLCLSAASPPPRKATFCRRRSSGRSCA
jgi:5-methyltetrahydropteroyltriglutamate--homocysteine methyltransferase